MFIRRPVPDSPSVVRYRPILVERRNAVLAVLNLIHELDEFNDPSAFPILVRLKKQFTSRTDSNDIAAPIQQTTNQLAGLELAAFDDACSRPHHGVVAKGILEPDWI